MTDRLTGIEKKKTTSEQMKLRNAEIAARQGFTGNK